MEITIESLCIARYTMLYYLNTEEDISNKKN